MGNLADHLRKHLRGEVLDSRSAVDYFSTDASILTVKPKAVVYPRNVTDVRKIAKFSWQLSERGKKLPITMRGKGSDQGGGALGEGLIMAMPAHMNRLIDIDRDTVSVEPGMLYGDLQRTLQSHGRFLPPYPASIEFSTIGGAVANNACGEKSLKYGCTADYIQELEVVLSNGDVIRTKPLSKRELSKKKGQTDLEGDIYRQIDGLLQDNEELIESSRPPVSKNSAGYALWDVRRDGKFDLSRLIAGSQGTLGLVTEVTLRTERFNPETHLIAAFFDNLDQAGEAITKLQDLKPSSLEMVDGNMLQFLRRHQPHQLKDIVDDQLSKLVLLVEFDDEKTSTRKRRAKKANKLLSPLSTEVRITTDPDEQEDLWKIRRSAAGVTWSEEGKKRMLPIIEDGVVPAERLTEFMQAAYNLFQKYGMEVAVWGHGGDANLHMHPFLDLDSTGDRQTVFKIMDEFYSMVLDMGGSTCGEQNDGRLRAPYLQQLYGQEMYKLFKEVKDAFDPHDILNPGVKIDVDRETVRKQLRREYNHDHLYDQMPRVHS